MWLLCEFCRPHPVAWTSSSESRAGERPGTSLLPRGLGSSSNNFHLSLLICKMGILAPTPIAIRGSSWGRGCETALQSAAAYTAFGWNLIAQGGHGLLLFCPQFWKVQVRSAPGTQGEAGAGPCLLLPPSQALYPPYSTRPASFRSPTLPNPAPPSFRPTAAVRGGGWGFPFSLCPFSQLTVHHLPLGALPRP